MCLHVATYHTECGHTHKYPEQCDARRAEDDAAQRPRETTWCRRADWVRAKGSLSGTGTVSLCPKCDPSQGDASFMARVRRTLVRIRRVFE